MSDAGVMEWRRDATAPSEETMFWFRGQVTAILRFSPTFAYLTITNSNECCDAVLRAEHGSSVTFIEQVVSTIEVGANVVVQGTRVAECAGDLREQAIQVTAIGLVDNVPDGSQSCEDGCLPPNALRVAREHESMAVKDEEDSKSSGAKVDDAGTTTGCSEDDHHTVFVDALLEVLPCCREPCTTSASGNTSNDCGVIDVAGGSGAVAFELACVHAIPVTIVDPRPALFHSHRKWKDSMQHSWKCLDLLDRAFHAFGGSEQLLTTTTAVKQSSTECESVLEPALRSELPPLTPFGRVLRKRFDVQVPAQLNEALIDRTAPVAERAEIARIASADSTASAGPPLPASSEVREKILGFYDQHFPEKREIGLQALQSHSGKEHELIDRFIEKYGQVAWNWFVGDGDEEEVPLPELTHEACGEEGHSDAKSVESWRLLHDTLLAGRVFIGLHADQATDYIAFFGFLYGKPWAVVPCCVYPRLFATRAIVRWPADTTVLESFHTVNLAKLLEGSKPVWSNSDLCEYFKSAGLLVSFHRFLKRIEQEHFPGIDLSPGGRDFIWKRAVSQHVESTTLSFDSRNCMFFWHPTTSSSSIVPAHLLEPKTADITEGDRSAGSSSSSTPIAEFEVERAQEELAVDYELFVKSRRRFEIISKGPQSDDVLAVSDIAIRQSFLNNDMSFDGTGGAVWPVSERIVDLLPTDQELRALVCNTICVTFGCGIGLLDIALLLNGAHQVIATDGDNNVLVIAEDNGQINQHAIARARARFDLTDVEPSASSNSVCGIEYQMLRWGNVEHTAEVLRSISLSAARQTLHPQEASRSRLTMFCVDVMYHRPAFPDLFRAIFDVAVGSCKILGLDPIEVQPPVVSEYWSWSGTESETESEDSQSVDGEETEDAAPAAVALSPMSIILGTHKRDEDKEQIVWHMCAHCPSLQLVRQIDIGALYILRVYNVLPGTTTPNAIDLYRAACLECLE